MASPLSPSRRQQSPSLSRSALRARDALGLEHLPLADALASAAARRLFPLVEREDLIQVAREALVRSAARCRAGESAAPYLRRSITGACSTTCVIASAWCASPAAEPTLEASLTGPALEQLVAAQFPGNAPPAPACC